LVSTAVPIIAAKHSFDLPLPAPSGNFSISPNLATISEKDGSASFTITRTNFSQAVTVYVSTVHDQGFDNPNGNTFYNGLFNKQVTFAAGAATAQIQLTINDQKLGCRQRTFRLMVQQNAADPIGTYLASTRFTIVNNDPGIVADANINELLTPPSCSIHSLAFQSQRMAYQYHSSIL